MPTRALALLHYVGAVIFIAYKCLRFLYLGLTAIDTSLGILESSRYQRIDD